MGLRTYILSIMWIACAPQDGDTSPLATPTACDQDGDCLSGEVCNESLCTLGDRDNGFSHAQRLPFGEPGVEGVIVPEGDVDFWAYESTGREWVRVSTTTTGDPDVNLDTVVQVWSPDHQLHAEIDNYATGRVDGYDSVLYAYLPTAGIWTITVEDLTHHLGDEAPDKPGGGETFTYTLRVEAMTRFTTEDGGVGGGVSIDVEDGDSIYATGVVIDSPGDVDTLTLELTSTAQQPLEVWGLPTLPGTSFNPWIELYLDGQLASSKEGLGPSGYLSYFTAEPGSYTLQASDMDGQHEGWMVLFVRTYDTGDNHPYFDDSHYLREEEPNDLPSTANRFGANEAVIDAGPYLVWTVEGALTEDNDQDQYELPVLDTEKVSVRCFHEDFGSNAALSVRLFDGFVDLTPEDQGDTILDNFYYVMDADPGPAGTYTVAISDVEALGGLDRYYRCRVLVAPFNWGS